MEALFMLLPLALGFALCAAVVLAWTFDDLESRPPSLTEKPESR